MAAAAVAEMGENASATLRALSGIGNHGKLPGNALRDLLRLNWHGSRIEPPNVYWAKVPFKAQAGAEVQEIRPHPFLLPHDFLHALWQDQEVFGDMCYGPDPVSKSQAKQQ